jgi:hypothetical protein
VPAPQRTARIEDDIWNPAQERALAEGASLAALMRTAVQRYSSGELTSQALSASQPGAGLTSHPGPASQGAPSIAAISPGEPCPGTACAAPGCWQRDTARYGLRRPVLCTACAAALQGEAYKREPPPGAARAMRRGRPAVSRGG